MKHSLFALSGAAALLISSAALGQEMYGVRLGMPLSQAESVMGVSSQPIAGRPGNSRIIASEEHVVLACNGQVVTIEEVAGNTFREFAALVQEEEQRNPGGRSRVRHIVLRDGEYNNVSITWGPPDRKFLYLYAESPTDIRVWRMWSADNPCTPDPPAAAPPSAPAGPPAASPAKPPTA